MSENIKTIKILGKDIELCPYLETKSLIYNPQNNRLILTTPETIQNLKNLKTETAQSKVKEFVFSKYKRGELYDFHFLRLKFKMKSFKPLLKFLYYITSPIVSTVFLILNLFILFSPKIIYENSISNLNSQISHEISYNFIPLLIGTIIILIIHELSHFAVYSHYLKPIYFSCGLSIRYFSLLLFFTDVPFIRTLSIKERRRITLAGIESQLFVSVILFCISYFIHSSLFFILYLQNIGLIVINLMPFLRLDGYWLVNSFLGTDDYMKDFFKMVKHQRVVDWKVLFLGTLNSVLIVLNIVLLAYTIYINV